jgi:adenylosuccinate synthase
MGFAEKLAEYITDTDVFINKMISDNKNILCEGAQGTLLDIDHGTYPFVTSSNPVAGGACIGLGISPTKISKVLGVIKVYTTRVGSGPFPTEIRENLGETIREKGGEYGATTGRPRRCGWLDMVILRHAAMINGFTGIALTKLDILDGIEKIRICTSYTHKGSPIDVFPKELNVFENCEPVYTEIEGWEESTVGINDQNKLPKAAQNYIQTIESMLGVEVQLISTGKRRDELIVLKEQFA